MNIKDLKIGDVIQYHITIWKYIGDCEDPSPFGYYLTGKIEEILYDSNMIVVNNTWDLDVRTIEDVPVEQVIRVIPKFKVGDYVIIQDIYHQEHNQQGQIIAFFELIDSLFPLKIKYSYAVGTFGIFWESNLIKVE